MLWFDLKLLRLLRPDTEICAIDEAAVGRVSCALPLSIAILKDAGIDGELF